MSTCTLITYWHMLSYPLSSFELRWGYNPIPSNGEVLEKLALSPYTVSHCHLMFYPYILKVIVLLDINMHWGECCQPSCMGLISFASLTNLPHLTRQQDRLVRLGMVITTTRYIRHSYYIVYQGRRLREHVRWLFG